MAEIPATTSPAIAGDTTASPSVDLPRNSSPAFDYTSLQQQQQQRSGSLPRISQMQQQYGAAAAAGAMRMYGGGQMSFASPQVPGGGISRAGMIGQGGQIGQSAAHFNMQSQLLGQQPRQKMGLVQGSSSGQTLQGSQSLGNSSGLTLQGSQSLGNSSGLTLQGAQSLGNSSGLTLQGAQLLGMIGGLGMNTQIRVNANENLVYNQQRIPGTMRQQPSSSSQTQLTSSQGQTVPRQLSLAAMNPQLSGLTQNGQSALVQSTLSPQWLKQMQPGMSGVVSPSYQVQQQQQQAFLQQQLSSSQLNAKSMGLSQQQISQLIQQQPQLATQHHQQQRQQLATQHQQQLQQLSMQHHQHQQQQPSPRMPGPAVQNSTSLTVSQSGTSGAGGTIAGSSSQGTKASNQLLGKRKIQDLVAEVAPNCMLDPDVEDLLLEFADKFIDSVTAFSCNIAKNRKSSTVEAKDILLNLEKNWGLTIPGYSEEENKNQRTPVRTTNSQQPERDAPAGKGMNDSSGVGPSARPLPISQQSATQPSQKVTRF